MILFRRKKKKKRKNIDNHKKSQNKNKSDDHTITETNLTTYDQKVKKRNEMTTGTRTIAALFKT